MVFWAISSSNDLMVSAEVSSHICMIADVVRVEEVPMKYRIMNSAIPSRNKTKPIANRAALLLTAGFDGLIGSISGDKDIIPPVRLAFCPQLNGSKKNGLMVRIILPPRQACGCRRAWHRRYQCGPVQAKIWSFGESRLIFVA